SEPKNILSFYCQLRPMRMVLESATMTTLAKTAGENLTELLHDWREGDKAALDRLTPLVYDELRRIAHRYVQRERDGHTLQTTALINEAYLRLAGADNIEWQSRAHFFAVTAQVMRHVLIDHARRRRYVKHGGEAQRIPFDLALAETVQMSQPRA